VKKTNVYENSDSFVIRMKLALGGVLFLAAIVLRHYWDFLGYVLYGVLNDPVPAAPARLAVSVLPAALTS
jgi:hypothetical protein